MWLLDLIRYLMGWPKASSSIRLKSTVGPPSLQGQSTPTGSSRMVQDRAHPPTTSQRTGEGIGRAHSHRTTLCPSPRDHRLAVHMDLSSPQALPHLSAPGMWAAFSGNRPSAPSHRPRELCLHLSACSQSSTLPGERSQFPGFSLRLRLVEWHFLQPLLQPWHPV